jgi:CRP-like cAMP-binding protein
VRLPQTNHSTHKNRILAALPQADLDQFFNDLDPVALSLKQILYPVGAPLEHVYFIEQGIASVLTSMADGASIEVGMIGTEGIVGLPALLGGDISDQQIIVQVSGTAQRMDANSCRTAFDGSPAVRRAALRFTEGLLALSGQTAACNRLHSTEQRFARWLLMARTRLESDDIPMTHEFLSTMLGVRRTGVTEVATKLRRVGLIRYHHGEITILDREALEATACECHLIDRRRLLRVL